MTILPLEIIQKIEEEIRPYPDIMEERLRQNKKWGKQRHDWGWWATILGEEYGEVCQEMLRYHFGDVDNLPELREELVQVAAVAVAIIEHVDELIASGKDPRKPPPKIGIMESVNRSNSTEEESDKDVIQLFPFDWEDKLTEFMSQDQNERESDDGIQ